MPLLVQTNQKIKDYSVHITDGSEKKLSEFCGPKGLVLYFYPKDDTPGCTTQACDFRDNVSALQKAGYGVLGVSGDSLKSHKKFTQKYNLNFPLISDDGHEIAKELGVYGDKNMYGKIVQGITRTTLILDPNLSVVQIYKSVRAKGHVEKVISALQS